MNLPAHFIPPLENGDHLTRSEFERRYEAIPQVKKAELVEGIVYMASPLRFESHGKPHSAINDVVRHILGCNSWDVIG